jgi:2-methylcitrate dehydratase PrpD
MTAVGRLAEFATKVVALPPAVRAATSKAVLDLVGAAIAGYGTRSASAARQVVQRCWGHGQAAVWFSGQTSTVAGAAFANAASACAQDLDDGHRAAAGHPGAAIIPAVLACAAPDGADPSRIATAIAIGYEIGVRISASRDLSRVPTTDSGLWCGQAVAAAYGWLAGLDAGTMMHAIAIAGTTAPSQSATPYTRFMGNQVKEGIPWATSNGVLAAELARLGFTGPHDLLDAADRYDQGTLLGDLGGQWQIETVYFKPYACCRWIHAALDALFHLKALHGIPPEAISAIQVETFSRALTLNNEMAPRTLESAQYSIPFCLGVAGWFGPSAFLPLEEHVLTEPRIIGLSRKVTISVDPALDRMFSAAVPARLHVTTPSGTYSHEVLAPRGEPSNAMSWDDVSGKLLAVMEGRMHGAPAERLLDAIAPLRDGNIVPLLAALRMTPSSDQRPVTESRLPAGGGAPLLTSRHRQNV